MAKRRPDPRVRTNATPPTTRTVGVNANKVLALHMHLAKCRVKDCEEHPVVSLTVNGAIERYCLTHFRSKNERNATQEELDMLIRWAVKFAA